MITNRGKIKIDDGIEFLSDWQDGNGQYRFDQYLTNSKIIVNKVATGCGFTTYCLCNNENTILTAPRVSMLKNKMEQFNENKTIVFYFNREKSGNKSFQDLQYDFQEYCQLCMNEHRPLKLLVTYDSFNNLADMLEQVFGIDINRDFRICIDESHSLIKDIPLKEFNNNLVLTHFLKRIFQYDKLVFISATPIINYISSIDEFQQYAVDYWELDWSETIPVDIKPYSCRSSVDAFDQIYKIYSQNTDQYGRNVFDVIHYGGGRSDYSYEAVIFLNNVSDIRKIINKYVNKLQLIDLADITVFCANTPENIRDLHKTNAQLSVRTSIPKKGEKHTTWTFATRTVFEGADFYSPSASSYAVANYNTRCLSLDIASDIPQIIGRQRLKSNKFRQRLHVFYTNSISSLTDDEFKALQKEKMELSRQQISIYKTAPDDCKALAFKNVRETIERHPEDYYLKTVNGYPTINDLIVISEQYSRDITNNQICWRIMPSRSKGVISYSDPVKQLLCELGQIMSAKSMQGRIKKVYEYMSNLPECESEIYAMLSNEGYTDVAFYFNELSLERIFANGFDTWKMDSEISFRRGASDIKAIVSSRFESGKIYSKKEIKTVLQEIYNNTNMQRNAKATDLPKYIDCKECKKDGLKAYKVL